MSAYVVSDVHIHYLVLAGLEWAKRNRCTLRYGDSGQYELTYEDADELAALLKAENIKSVWARYPNDERAETLPGRMDEPRGEVRPVPIAHALGHRAVEFFPPAVLKAIDCYEYQSCEHDGWKRSTAYQYCDQLRRDWCTEVEGWRESPWGLDELPRPSVV